MQSVLQGVLWHKCSVYIDDIICLGEDFETALDNLRLVLERLHLNNLKLKPKKCALMQKQMCYLGRMVSPSGISIAEEHVRKIKEWPIPVTKHEIESFLGFMNYHRQFCKIFAEITDSLYKLATSVLKSNSCIDLSEEHLGAIEYLRTQLLQAPVLPYPDVESTLILDYDASNIAIGSALS